MRDWQKIQLNVARVQTLIENDRRNSELQDSVEAEQKFFVQVKFFVVVPIKFFVKSMTTNKICSTKQIQEKVYLYGPNERLLIQRPEVDGVVREFDLQDQDEIEGTKNFQNIEKANLEEVTHEPEDTPHIHHKKSRITISAAVLVQWCELLNT